MTLDAALSAADRGLDAALERLFALLRIPSISTDPVYHADCVKAADWLVDELTGLGFAASRRDTPGKPMVVARHEAPGPKMLFYGHYDVQPVDPLELWDRKPFDPAVEDTAAGKVIRARGAADDKGQMMTFVEAMRAWKAATGALPGNLVLLFEGEEESGSPSLIPFLEAHREELAADIAFVCDTGMFDTDTPSITTMLRGLLAVEFAVKGPSRDLHSGLFGGPAMNPNRVLAKILSQLHDGDGRVTIPGFYDGVTPVPEEIAAGWRALDFDAAAFLGEVGLSVPAGEQGFSVLEQVWARPTAEINGMWGGYTGAGFKTVLPARASAKVSFRLVGTQDPIAIRDAFRAWIEARLPEDFELEFVSRDGAPATVMPTGRPEFARARAALSAEWPNPAVFAGGGGSIPIVGRFREILGVDSVLIGFGLDDDGIHSPNEKYSLRSFHKGIRSWVRVLDAVRAG
ncbi:M20/M25/M40 family metallo-hydrolase [Rhodobacteraceae bacterium 2CG4]|uniref:M20/M25/M40 family metallo-hydrolase n=1 Tax=Halovulum marinum TaxID=2662447 RepID=A0A6L5Z0D8_9RHOB|nr:M20/M25/M40 family metallo-hydrolase [Halovulum marinum]MSU90001.1 M20/M25/M40 family metallo-hydrolase [Halovulum marinum]